jgi:hypothetical protein
MKTMRRLPYLLAVIIAIWTIGLITIPLSILWLLGAETPFKTIVNAFDKVVFIKSNKITE